jgi:hypothetical protein
MRSQLADEEGATFLVAMEALQRFITRYRAQLEKPPLKALQSSYKIPNPEKNGGASPLKVTVKTLPQVTAELAAEADDVLGDGPEGLVDFPVLRDDYVPEGAIIILTQFQQQVLNDLRHDSAIVFQGLEGKWAPNGTANSPDLPVVLIQTSRPKAKTLIQQLQQANGVQAVCFNPGSDPFSGEAFELGLLQTGDGELHLFAEYETNGSTDRHLLSAGTPGRKTVRDPVRSLSPAALPAAARANQREGYFGCV